MTLGIWGIQSPHTGAHDKEQKQGNPRNLMQWISKAGTVSQKAEAGSGGQRLSSVCSYHREFQNPVDSVSAYANWPEILAA